jgi:O-antigen ligase
VTKRAQLWAFIFSLIFIISLPAAATFALQLRRSAPAPPANFLAADKGYGVTIDLTRYDEAELAQTLTDLRQNGLTWIRQPVNWAELEPSPNRIHWQEFDRVLAAVAYSNDILPYEQRAQKFKIIAVLQTSPAWARAEGAPETAPPTHLSDFGRFAQIFARRYGGQIDYYQIWREPNLSAGWGDAFVDASAYADMLREAHFNIGEADSQSYILTAALAATLENGPLNVNELDYLDQLYQAKANQWFDIVALQPLGLWTKPLDAPAPDTLNFRRAELARQVMLKHGDADTPVWATAFGWVALPAAWSGRPSPWSYDAPAVQAPRTVTAIQFARQNWPWLGPMLAVRWDATGLDAADPARGFALLETPAILEAFKNAAARQATFTPGRYPADHPAGQYSPDWRLALTRADIPHAPPRRLVIPFEGTRLDLELERGPFRGYLWVTVDGQPANALPQNGQGQSYVVLYDPLRARESVTLAQRLPPGRHGAIIEADGGWGQWAVLGWAVLAETDTRFYRVGFAITGMLAVAGGAGLVWLAVRARKQITKLAWSEIFIALYAILGERGQMVVMLALAVTIFVMQGWAGLALLPLLALAILLRPDLGLALMALAIYFAQIPLRLPVISFSPLELLLALTSLGVIFRTVTTIGRTKYSVKDTSSQSSAPPIINYQLSIINLKSTDLAALSLVVLALLSTLAAANFAVSLRELRVVIIESVIFYFLVCLSLNYQLSIINYQLTTFDNSKFKIQNSKLKTQNSQWIWRLIDAFVTGATLQAISALYLYFFTERSIDAEGVHRALGLGYGSPNNLALMLARAWPILLAVAVAPGPARARRAWYGVGLLLTSLALYLTFSKGALLLGLPAGMVVMALLYGMHRWPRHRGWVIAGAAGVLALFSVSLIPFSQTQRFQAAFDFGEGSTAFFRVKLWQASWAMLQEHWPLGVGPDNFLYQYRTRYILPEAWQEPNLNHPHNFFLDFGTRLGVGGIVIFFWLQIAFWRNIWRVYRAQFSPLILGLMGSMVTILAHGLVDNSYFLVDLAFTFFLVVGITQALAQNLQRQ